MRGLNAPFLLGEYMWKSLKTWLADNEKLALIPYAIAIPMIFLFPQYLFQIPLALFLLYKVWDVATDKSTNSVVKEIRTILGEKPVTVATPVSPAAPVPATPPATPAT
jgi:hypothetical protein